MLVKEWLQEIIDSKMVERIIVLHDHRSGFISWCFLYDLRRGYYQFSEKYTELKLTEEQHYTKDGEKCIGLWI